MKLATIKAMLLQYLPAESKATEGTSKEIVDLVVPAGASAKACSSNDPAGCVSPRLVVMDEVDYSVADRASILKRYPGATKIGVLASNEEITPERLRDLFDTATSDLTEPNMIDPATDLAKLQDYALSTTEYTPDEARLMLGRLDRFNVFLATQPYSNLKIRQRCLHLGLLHIMGVSIGRDTEVDLSPLISNGRWVEGPSYYKYSMAACEWLRAVSGRVVSAPSVDATYDGIVAPDGSIPVPEAREGGWAVPDHPADMVSTPAYMVKRWPSGAYLLVCVDPEIIMRDNLHVHAECGYFALYIPRQKSRPVGWYAWRVRCRPYTGWAPETLLDSNGLLQMLPPGAVLPTWRVKPPRITVTRLEYGVEIRWSNGGWFDSKRTITWTGGVVRVVDKWMGVRKRVREWGVV